MVRHLKILRHDRTLCFLILKHTLFKIKRRKKIFERCFIFQSHQTLEAQDKIKSVSQLGKPSKSLNIINSWKSINSWNPVKSWKVVQKFFRFGHLGIPFNIKPLTKLNKFDSTNVKLLSDKNRHGLELDNNKFHVHQCQAHHKTFKI